MHRKRRQNVENSPPRRQDNSLNHVENVDSPSGEEKIVKVVTKNDENSPKGNPVSRVTEYGCGISFVGVLKVVLLIIIVPPVLNFASLQRETGLLRPQGEMHAGPLGNKLYINCTGRGLPVVMMDTPGGYSSDIWSLVQPQLAKFTKVCVYDRAGLGFSERAMHRFYGDQQSNISPDGQDFKYEKLRPTTENMVADIHHLLNVVTNNTSNVVLVGGGLGANNAQFYARFYENIFGMILINPFHENMYAKVEWTKFWYDHFIPLLQMEQLLSFLGVTRLGILSRLFQPNILVGAHFEDDVTMRLKHLSCNSQHLSAGIMEHYYINESLVQLKILQKLKPFPENISVTLISSKNFSDYLTPALNKFWFEHQMLLAQDVFPQRDRTIIDGDLDAVYFNAVEVIVKAVKNIVQKFRKSVKQSANI